MIICGGSAVPRSLMENFEQRYGVRIVQAWGMTETSPLAAVAHPPAHVEIGSPEEMDWRARTGRVVGGVELRIVDDLGSPLPWDGEAVGEIEVRGPWITGSYFRDPSPEKFDDGWLRTGDVGTVTPDGYVQITDRAKDVIKSGGEWISSVELENILMGHPDVVEASVIGVPDPRWDERPLACVVIKRRLRRRRRPSSRRTSRPRSRSGRCPNGGASSTRCRRHRSASSTRRCCAPVTRRATCRSSRWTERTPANRVRWRPMSSWASRRANRPSPASSRRRPRRRSCCCATAKRARGAAREAVVAARVPRRRVGVPRRPHRSRGLRRRARRSRRRGPAAPRCARRRKKRASTSTPRRSSTSPTGRRPRSRPSGSRRGSSSARSPAATAGRRRRPRPTSCSGSGPTRRSRRARRARSSSRRRST